MRLLGLGVAINIFLILLVLALKSFLLPPQVPVFYGLPEGVEQLAPASYLSLPLAVSLTFVLVNSSLSALISSEFLKNVLTVTSSFLLALSAITTLKIAFLVGGF